MGNIISCIAELSQDDDRGSTRSHCSCYSCRHRSRHRRRRRLRENGSWRRRREDSLLDSLVTSVADFFKAETEHTKARTEQRKARRKEKEPEPAQPSVVSRHLQAQQAPQLPQQFPPAPAAAAAAAPAQMIQEMYQPAVAAGALRDNIAHPNAFAMGIGSGGAGLMGGNGNPHTAREFYHIAHSPGPSGRRRKGKRVKRNEAPPESEESEWPPGEKGWRLRPRQPMRRPDVGENLSRAPGVDHPPPQIPPLHGAARREPM
ncbi:hypothetical protein D8B26_002279 [Coccidioides posadasii str. Silveira]|uniref:Uncharacterized protein n=1 Tax=Coccidioides posadasii (strain RMSCC 757 / Silveira) TaxID=443226 RepID=E9DDA1_COCPS|nr:conserved hypothetical protein [Coccidioides posadasii str. Silveira]QVM07582.1 hypothetical protein D8B26_002279 [Coccidioides posadasii str. Silveira]